MEKNFGTMTSQASGNHPTGDQRSAIAGPTPGPWRECGRDRGGCVCGIIWSTAHDHPVAAVTSGPWGDEYPSLRFAEGGEGTVTPSKVEAYIERIEYGSVDASEAKANARLIAAAPTMLAALEWIATHYGNQDLNHVDFRVEAKHLADAAILKATAQQPQTSEHQSGK